MNNNINLLYLIQSFNMGGAENLALILSKFLKTTNIRPLVCALENTGPLGNLLAESGIPYCSLEKNAGFDIGASFRLRKLIHKENITILHAHNLGPLIYGYLGTRFCSGLKFIYTEHVRLSQEVGNSAKLMDAAKFMVRSVDCFLSIAEHISEYMIHEFGVRNDKIITIPNGVDITKYAPHGNLKLEKKHAEAAPIIGNIAAMREQKDQLTLIESMAIVIRTIPDARLLIAGTGPLEKMLKDRVCDLRLNDHVIFLGHRTDIPELLNSFDLFVLPSLYEGLPLCLLESMACGTPVVATDVYGIRELVRHNETGLLVPPRDPAALADAIVSVLNNRDKLARFEAAGRQLVESEYDLDKALHKYHDLYLHYATGAS